MNPLGRSKVLELIRQKGIKELVRENHLLIPLMILFVISSFGVYTRPTEFTPLKIAGAVAIAVYFVAAFYRYILQRGGDFQYVEFIGALILALNFIVQLTGGLHSPWISLYTLLMIAVGINYSLRISLLTVVRIGLVEGFNALATSLRTDHHFETQHYLWLMLLLILVAIVGEASLVLLKRRLFDAEKNLDTLALRLEEEARERRKFLPAFVASVAEEVLGGALKETGHGGRSELRNQMLQGGEPRLFTTDAPHIRHSEEPSAARAEAASPEFENVFLNHLKAVLDATHVCFFARGEHNEFRMRWAAGPSKDFDVEAQFAEGQGLLGFCVKSKAPLSGKRPPRSMPSAPRDFVYLKRSREDIRAYMMEPILHAGRVEGVLVADRVMEDRDLSRDAHEFTPADQRIMKTAVELMRLEWQKTRAAQYDRQSNEILTLFLRLIAKMSATLDIKEVASLLLNEARELMEFETAALAVVSENGSAYSLVSKVGFEVERDETIPPNARTWTRWAIGSAEDAVWLSDFRPGEKQMPIYAPSESPLEVGSFLAIPLGEAAKRRGALVMTHRQPDRFNTEAEQMIRLLCRHAAVILENAIAHQQMETMAITDVLTRLPNHRYFQDRLEEEISRARRTQRPLSLLMLDIDHFKKFNDTHGPPFGDAVLSHTAGIIERCLRREDFAARYGGEEFALLLTDTAREGARETAERLRAEVERTLFAYGGSSARVTVSGGLATFPRDGASKEQLRENADRALYYAKRAGRNRIVQFHVIDAMQLKFEFRK